MNSKLLLGLALVLSARIVMAQPGGGFTHRSLETKIAQAPIVFRATITNVLETVIHTNHHDWQGRDIASDDCYYAVTLKIDEVLKGKLPRKSLKFLINHVAQWPELTKWSNERVSILWFWNGSEENMGKDFHGNPSIHIIWLGPTLPGLRDNGLSFFPPIYDMDMTILTRPDDILARARAFARKRMNTTSFHKIYLPDQSSSDHYFFNSYLVVPVEPPLEKTAKRLLAVPGDFISKTNEPALVPQWRCDLRAEGVNALQYFKSDKNIKLLKSLLDAPDCWMIRDYATQYRGMNVTNKIYSVRSKAYEVLKGWGVDVPKPVTEETMPAKYANP